MNTNTQAMILDCKTVRELAFGEITGLRDGTRERADSMAISSHLGRVNTSIVNELKVRLAAQKIAAMEARVVGAGDDASAIAAPKTSPALAAE